MSKVQETRVVDIREAEARLEDLINELAAGERFLISIDGVLMASLAALTEEEIAGLELGEGDH
jgi:antitoxin (DNA-binding transcriptional repressor) of toxin-antitoxin stability system